MGRYPLPQKHLVYQKAQYQDSAYTKQKLNQDVDIILDFRKNTKKNLLFSNDYRKYSIKENFI